MHRTWAEIPLDRIAANYHALRAEAGEQVITAPVVKANAYGHGSAEVARRLEAEGAPWFCVSNADEGVVLRDAGISARILVMGGFLDFERETMLGYDLTPVVHCPAQLRDLDRLAGHSGCSLTYHLKLDTGMGRLGARAPLPELIEAVRQARHVHLEGLMTHFASANDFVSGQTAEQMAGFESAVQTFRAAGLAPPLLHLSSSGPVAYGLCRAYGKLVRPGLALYGYVSPALGTPPHAPLAVLPALTWKAHILQIKQLPPGEPVGYGALWHASRHSLIAVVAAGYADGIPHQLSNRGHVLAAGRLAPIVGAVSMDLITVDVTDTPQLRPGDAVTLLGEEETARYNAGDMAAEAGIIPYAVLCGIGNRVRRVYTSPTAAE